MPIDKGLEMPLLLRGGEVGMGGGEAGVAGAGILGETALSGVISPASEELAGQVASDSESSVAEAGDVRGAAEAEGGVPAVVSSSVTPPREATHELSHDSAMLQIAVAEAREAIAAAPLASAVEVSGADTSAVSAMEAVFAMQGASTPASTQASSQAATRASGLMISGHPTAAASLCPSPPSKPRTLPITIALHPSISIIPTSFLPNFSSISSPI
ncbi:unnamed protein product [Closterium sp. Naga37s-1]|nr:unnamed protein product [Closterium sp. Naga37s-1]